MNKEDKRSSQEFENYDPEVVLVCKVCNGLYPCWCEHHDYRRTWKFVWEAVKNCKGF